MNRMFLGVGIFIWLLAMFAVRLIGHLLFLTDNAPIMIGLTFGLCGRPGGRPYGDVACLWWTRRSASLHSRYTGQAEACPYTTLFFEGGSRTTSTVHAALCVLTFTIHRTGKRLSLHGTFFF